MLKNFGHVLANGKLLEFQSLFYGKFFFVNTVSPRSPNLYSNSKIVLRLPLRFGLKVLILVGYDQLSHFVSCGSKIAYD